MVSVKFKSLKRFENVEITLYKFGDENYLH